jgi:hypothetical protein
MDERERQIEREAAERAEDEAALLESLAGGDRAVAIELRMEAEFLRKKARQAR